MCNRRYVLTEEASEFYNIDMSLVLKLPQLSWSRDGFLHKAF